MAGYHQFCCVLLLALAAQGKGLAPPPNPVWPLQFSVEYNTLAYGKNFSAEFFYDWTVESGRNDYPNCIFLGMPCSTISIGEKYYVSMPTLKTCCLVDENFSVPPPNWLDSFSFEGEVVVDHFGSPYPGYNWSLPNSRFWYVGTQADGNMSIPLEWAGPAPTESSPMAYQWYNLPTYNPGSGAVPDGTFDPEKVAGASHGCRTILQGCSILGKPGVSKQQAAAFPARLANFLKVQRGLELGAGPADKPKLAAALKAAATPELPEYPPVFSMEYYTDAAYDLLHPDQRSQFHGQLSRDYSGEGGRTDWARNDYKDWCMMLGDDQYCITMSVDGGKYYVVIPDCDYCCQVATWHEPAVDWVAQAGGVYSGSGSDYVYPDPTSPDKQEWSYFNFSVDAGTDLHGNKREFTYASTTEGHPTGAPVEFDGPAPLHFSPQAYQYYSPASISTDKKEDAFFDPTKAQKFGKAQTGDRSCPKFWGTGLLSCLATLPRCFNADADKKVAAFKESVEMLRNAIAQGQKLTNLNLPLAGPKALALMAEAVQSGKLPAPASAPAADSSADPVQEEVPAPVYPPVFSIEYYTDAAYNIADPSDRSALDGILTRDFSGSVQADEQVRSDWGRNDYKNFCMMPIPGFPDYCITMSVDGGKYYVVIPDCDWCCQVATWPAPPMDWVENAGGQLLNTGDDYQYPKPGTPDTDTYPYVNWTVDAGDSRFFTYANVADAEYPASTPVEFDGPAPFHTSPQAFQYYSPASMDKEAKSDAFWNPTKAQKYDLPQDGSRKCHKFWDIVGGGTLKCAINLRPCIMGKGVPEAEAQQYVDAFMESLQMVAQASTSGTTFTSNNVLPVGPKAQALIAVAKAKTTASVAADGTTSTSK